MIIDRYYLKQLNLSDYIINIVEKMISQNIQEYCEYADDLIDINKAEQTFVKIKEKYIADDKCFNILCIYLLSSLKTLMKYKELNISEKVFFDTMGCFSRFIKECKVMNNEEYFDRDFWVYRQLSLKLFRIGELEYELMNDDGVKSISVHIPSDAILSNDRINSSLKEMYAFIEMFYPDYVNCLVYCDSWLLSPKIKNYLNNNSRILLFQEYFEIIKVDYESNEGIRWLFQINTDNSFDYQSLKEETSLQRLLKKELLNGNAIGSAYGKLKVLHLV